MVSKQSIPKKDIAICMAAGCLLGILCFVLVYGVKILDFTYDAWILDGEIDLKQHYLGFCHLRNNSWSFPLGTIKTLSKPFDMSVMYTDSIPLFALFLKIFAGILPVHFQYFGLFGIMSFALMGALSAVLIRRFTDKYVVCIGGSLFFILSFPVLHRMYYHTALAAQWILVLAFIVWLYTDVTKPKTWIYWGLIGLLSVSIHSYFVFFTGVILLVQVVEFYIVKKCLKNSDVNIYEYDTALLNPVMPVIVFCLTSLISLFVFGAFYGAGRVTKGGFGDFNGNLNGYINPDGYSKIFKAMEYNGTFEYEGFGYLGAGVFLLLAVGAVYIIYQNINGKLHSDNGRHDASYIGVEYIKKAENIRIILMCITIFAVLILSTVPRFSFNDKLLLDIPLPAFIKTMLGVCRTNGRFIWIGTYLFIILSLYFVGRHYEKLWIKVLFALAVILQLFEMSGKVAELHDRYTEQRTYEDKMSEPDLLKMFDGRDELIFMYDGGDYRMDTAYSAYVRNMSQNTFYFARPIDDETNEYTEKTKNEFLNGNVSYTAVYLFRDEDYTDEFQAVVHENNGVECRFDSHIAVICSKN